MSSSAAFRSPSDALNMPCFSPCNTTLPPPTPWPGTQPACCGASQVVHLTLPPCPMLPHAAASCPMLLPCPSRFGGSLRSVMLHTCSWPGLLPTEVERSAGRRRGPGAAALASQPGAPAAPARPPAHAFTANLRCGKARAFLAAFSVVALACTKKHVAQVEHKRGGMLGRRVKQTRCKTNKQAAVSPRAGRRSRLG